MQAQAAQAWTDAVDCTSFCQCVQYECYVAVLYIRWVYHMVHQYQYGTSELQISAAPVCECYIQGDAAIS